MSPSQTTQPRQASATSGSERRRTTSKLRSAARIAFIVTAALACAGFILANLIVGDQTPPYEPSLGNELAWNTFLISGALAAVLGLLRIGWLIRDENRR